LARIIGLDGDGALVDWPRGRAAPTRALCAVPVGPAAIGRTAAVLWTDGSSPQAVIVGLIEPPGTANPVAQIDGKRIVLAGEQEIVLACGEASITLTRAGKILIRGAYVSSRSSGVNRIRGASVEVN
jgi:hypothetical protein